MTEQFEQTFPIDIVDKVLTEKFNHVVYVDTDSVFLLIDSFVPETDDVQLITKSIYKISDDLESFINKTVINEFCNLHNIDISSSSLSFKQEVIARKSLFFGVKKKYVLDIIDKERNLLPESKYDIKGLETKRSDFPSESKRIMQVVLDMIMKENKDYPELLKFLKKDRERVMGLIESGDLSVGRPVSYGKAKYDGTIPGHIVGMHNWNDIFYECFHQGTKGYMFYTKGIDVRKVDDRTRKKYEKFLAQNPKGLTQIVVPDKENKIPEGIIIDKERMIDLVFDKRILVLVHPFGIKDINWSFEQSSVLSW